MTKQVVADVNLVSANDLADAVWNGNIEDVKLLINKGADVNEIYNNKYQDHTTLMLAAKKGNAEIVRILLERGVELDRANKMGYTALVWASMYGHTDIVRLLSDSGADINTKEFQGYTSLMFASNRGHTETVRLLLDRKADCNAVGLEGITALMVAINSNAHDDQADRKNKSVHDGLRTRTKLMPHWEHYLILDSLSRFAAIHPYSAPFSSRSQAPPGNALFGRLRLPSLSASLPK